MDEPRPDFEALVAGAMALRGSSRSAYLRESCGDDEELRMEVLREVTVREALPKDDPGDGPVSATDLGRTPSGRVLERLEAHTPRETRYRFLGKIAHGAMGAVYKVWDEDLRRSLAMKVVLGKEDSQKEGSTPAVEERVLQRFLEEAQVTGQLDHPGIVPVHELGVDDEGRVFFTMRLVRGRDLRRAFELARAEKDGWTMARALSSVLRVCEAMAFAHSRGVVHRDLKPSNVMVGRFGETYVMDWGLARVAGKPDTRASRRKRKPPSSETQVRTDRAEDKLQGTPSPFVTMDGDVVGTPSYMSLEQAQGDLDRLGPRSDVYSVGAMLYELLTGRPPYVDPGVELTQHDVYERVLAGPPEPVESLAPEQPAELVAICEKAMARHLVRRYPDMEALSEDLRAYQEGRVVQAHRTGPLVELNKWVRRNRTTATVAASLIAVLVVSSILVAVSERRRALGIQRSADAALVIDLLEVDRLGPIHPDKAAAREAWLAQVAALAGRGDEYGRELEALRSSGVRASEASRPWGRAAQLAAELERKASLVEQWGLALERKRALRDDPELSPADRAKEARDILVIERERARLGADVERLRREEQRLAGLQDPAGLRLAELANALDWIEGEGRARIAQELEQARSLEHISLREHAENWASARDRVRTHPDYGGLDLEPQLGLVPLGPDMASGLEEFWHMLSGARPRRDAEGILQLEEDSGIVLVLVPGDTFWMGGQRSDPSAPGYDRDADPTSEGPAHEVALDPYFLSKYEMTTGQWIAANGEDPSARPAGSDWLGFGTVPRTHPVENVEWGEARRVLERWSLVLPTEAQWECAARAGTKDPFWWGPEASGANELANTYGEPRFPFHSPVGAFSANPFGFYGMVGNVAEWCLDWYAGNYEDVQTMPGTGELISGGTLFYRSIRGGSFRQRLEIGRAAARRGSVPAQIAEHVGLRAARPLDR